MRKVLVLGGTGMVGTAMKESNPEFMYLGSKPWDLRNEEDAKRFFRGEKDSEVIHLAARVGGVKSNTEFIGDFYRDNIMINTNVLHHAKEVGVKKVVSLLSTCVYPDPYLSDVHYPLTEDQLHNGPPHHSNAGYAYAKRMLEVQSRVYRDQFGCNFVTAIPNNLFGEHDNFDLENGHVIPSLIRKVWEAKVNKEPTVEVWGDGTPLREFTYSKDIARILVWMLENYDEPDPINIGCTVEFTIKEVVDLICENLGYDGGIVWNVNKPNGQKRKPSSNQRLLKLGWKESDYTPFEEALQNTCYWLVKNYPNVRGV